MLANLSTEQSIVIMTMLFALNQPVYHKCTLLLLHHIKHSSLLICEIVSCVVTVVFKWQCYCDCFNNYWRCDVCDIIVYKFIATN